jgi:hypothetical protein
VLDSTRPPVRRLSIHRMPWRWLHACISRSRYDLKRLIITLRRLPSSPQGLPEPLASLIGLALCSWDCDNVCSQPRADAPCADSSRVDVKELRNPRDYRPIEYWHVQMAKFYGT